MSVLDAMVNVKQRVCPTNQQKYAIAHPQDYPDDTARPLILILHWGWGKELVPPYFGQSNLVNWVQPALQALDVILVAPDCLRHNWTNPQSEADINHLLEHLQHSYAIDTDKIIILGKSKGGRGVWYLAERNQAQFAAAIIVAGEPLPHSAEVWWKLPIYLIHSRHDERFPFSEIEQVVHRQRAKGKTISFDVLETVTHYEYEGYIEPLQRTIPWIKRILETDQNVDE